MNILIADCGATKSEWCFLENGEVKQQFTEKGISPIYQTEEEIAINIRLNVLPHLLEYKADEVHFYGAGCIPEKIFSVRSAIFQSFPTDKIFVYSDIVAAAHALCGDSPGIACILGTGSNSCEWNGAEIVKQVPPLGFILGDEGSGAALGKQLVSDALKNQLTTGLKEKLLTKYNLTTETIIDKVYRQPFPSRFLANLSLFMLEYLDDKTIRRILEKSFTDFFERNVIQYDYRKNKSNFTGSIAWYFADEVREVAANKGVEIGKIEKSPMSGLIDYYGNYYSNKKSALVVGQNI
ncbi:MAG: ATPase [Dysgonamonadaceae bacterium]|jgi:N-acetylglucosamine kinase-like BadF-type ATPase|nr:ATPase [Dysgonamonadaceae bacterium]